MPGKNPYDSDFDETEADYIQFLEDATGRLKRLLHTDTVAPAQVPHAAAEVLARLEGVLKETTAERHNRRLGDAKAQLIRFFPASKIGGMGTPDSPLEIDNPSDEEIFEYVKAAYDAFGELLGDL